MSNYVYVVKEVDGPNIYVHAVKRNAKKDIPETGPSGKPVEVEVWFTNHRGTELIRVTPAEDFAKETR